ncbi:hypothetical protein ERJ75_000562700 [Trypanosoma vivax]|nr:hypothetical protein ERJ75_000562700 [Trypanosoma vivax]
MGAVPLWRWRVCVAAVALELGEAPARCRYWRYGCVAEIYVAVKIRVVTRRDDKSRLGKALDYISNKKENTALENYTSMLRKKPNPNPSLPSAPPQGQPQAGTSNPLRYADFAPLIKVRAATVGGFY